ncbi:GntR family transcriptional regulator [Variovorax sp. YR216]|uniref:GntR family transcriptional regulator n=1 Tax=Variovorax sp. YR216 TaxID=1882828 RepID=UPI000B871B89|nr:FCD domain-containing protein [Variovorax sp. YR216]
MHKIRSMQNADPTSNPPPLVEQAFARLRADVLAGAFAAGSKLKLDELQSLYGYSSSPLREALSRLSQEGLVRADERRGFRVAPISAEDLADITHMRVMLDVPALRESIAHGDDAWEATVIAAFHRLEKVESRLSDGPVVLDEEWSELHRAFHLALVGACPSERQRAWGASLFDQAERYRRYSARFRRTARRKSNEHRKLMDAALRRDADTACALLEEHILSTQRNVLAALRHAEGAER